MVDWQVEKKVVRLAVESTGIYWKPALNLLEGAGGRRRCW